MNSTIVKYIFVSLFLILVISCNNEEPNMPEQQLYVKVGDVTSSESSFDVQLLAKDSLFVGYNDVYFKITDKATGLAVEQATISLHPLMDMVTFSHACPFENPADTLTSDGYYQGVVIFSMIGTDSWSLSVDITANGKTETAYFPIHNVKSTTFAKKIVVMDSLSTGPGTWQVTKYPISIVEPKAWKVGNNPFEITIHRMASMMSFPCCDDLTVEIIPEMPSMGHGSPNNINPVSKGDGHYLGTVNFTMTGDWRINMVIKKDGRIISRKAYFDIVF